MFFPSFAVFPLMVMWERHVAGMIIVPVSFGIAIRSIPTLLFWGFRLDLAKFDLIRVLLF